MGMVVAVVQASARRSGARDLVDSIDVGSNKREQRKQRHNAPDLAASAARGGGQERGIVNEFIVNSKLVVGKSASRMVRIMVMIMRMMMVVVVTTIMPLRLFVMLMVLALIVMLN